MDDLSDFFQKRQGRIAGILTDYIDTAAHKITDTQGRTTTIVVPGFDPVPQGLGGKFLNDLLGPGEIPPENFE